MDPDHLLHHTITREETQPRLKSRRPFASSGKDLLSTAPPNETKVHWIARMWSAGWQPSTSRLREYIVSPSMCCPGCDLLRQAWVKLNRLRTGVGRFNADMWRWGLSKSSACDCGADQQTANHIITECPLHRPPNDLHSVIDVDAATREWLLSKFPEIYISFDFWFHTQEEEVCLFVCFVLFWFFKTKIIIRILILLKKYIDTSNWSKMIFNETRHVICFTS